MKRALATCGLLVATASLAVAQDEPTRPGDSARLQQRDRQIALLRKQAGLSTLSGPGVVVRLRDNRRVPVNRAGFGTGLVHDYDLLYLVNEMRAAQAEGIAINGVRLTGRSAIRAVGPRISVGSQAISAPYTVEAVGDPARPQRALAGEGGVLEGFRRSRGPEAQLVRAARLQLRAGRSKP